MTKKIGLKKTIDPPCSRTDCFACENKSCRILSDNNFGERKCPFFKTHEKFRADFEKYRKDG